MIAERKKGKGKEKDDKKNGRPIFKLRQSFSIEAYNGKRGYILVGIGVLGLFGTLATLATVTKWLISLLIPTN